MADPLRALWDFGDLDATERRFRARLDDEPDDAARAELLTQLGRVEGLRGRFEEGEQLVREAESLAGPSVAARTRVQLERGRLLRSGGDPAAALPLFEAAFATALAARQGFLAGDAAHMAALAAPELESLVAWTRRGLELGETDPEAAYWHGPLLNNLGWAYLEAGDQPAALDAFERALAARRRDPDRPAEIALARYAVGKALRAARRADEAAPHLEQAVAWADEAGEPDGWFHEELAEIYAALGRRDEAARQARLALPLLEAADSALREDPARRARLEKLARRPQITPP